jgi:hypothetical protein
VRTLRERDAVRADLGRTTGPVAPIARHEHPLLRLQRLHGNRYVARLLAGDGGAARAVPEVEEGVERERGHGQSLDTVVREQLQPWFQRDLGVVRVHADVAADRLSRAVDARAFTVGSDVFFREGEYAPETSEGRALLAHELTHVDQAGAATVGRRLEIGPADDEFEREADTVARDVVRREPELKIRRQVTAGADQPAEPQEPARAQEPPTPEPTVATAPPPPPAGRAEPLARTVRRAPGAATLRRQDPVSTAIGAGSLLQETAAGFQIASSVISTVNQGDLHVQWPTSPIGVTWPAKPAELHLTAQRADMIIFSWRKANPISGIEQVNIKLRCMVQFDGPQVQATFTFEPDGRRSRLMRDSFIEIGNPLSLETRVASPEWQRVGVHEYPVVYVPISVYVDQPWPVSNLSMNFNLILSGMSGFGAAGGQPYYERWQVAWT